MKSAKKPKRDKINMFFDEKNNRISTTGFTLIEIMVVVVIIILITSVTIVAINAARNRTRDAIIKSSVEQIQGIAETTYNPQDGYYELSLMVGDTAERDDDHDNIGEIRDRIRDMGAATLRVWFPEDGEDGKGWGEYCAYAGRLFHSDAKDKFFCVDSSGNEVIVTSDEMVCAGDPGDTTHCVEE